MFVADQNFSVELLQNLGHRIEVVQSVIESEGC